MNLKNISMFFNLKKDKFETTNYDNDYKAPIFLIVLVIVSFICDILKFTPIYNNNMIKPILDTNHFLSYGIGSILKGSAIFMLIMLTIERNKILIEYKRVFEDAEYNYNNNNSDTTKDAYDTALNEYNETKIGIYFNVIFCFIFLLSLILDIIQFTPLMQDHYINKIVTLNSNTQTVGLMIFKLAIPGLLSY